MNKIKAENLIEFVRTVGPLQLITNARKKSFTVRATDYGLEIVPSASKKVRKHRIKWLRDVCEKFSETHSFRSKDYRDVTANPSYSVAILRAYLGLNRYQDEQSFSSLVAFQNNHERDVKKALNDSPEMRRHRLASAAKEPPLRFVTTIVFLRNPDVVAEVLTRANGICEECGDQAPFFRKTDHSPYLEVHHRVQLANGGEDTVQNAIALCPNCHRKKHHGEMEP
jgi:hypothetical protein